MRCIIILFLAINFHYITTVNAQEYGTELGVFLVDDLVSHLDRPTGIGAGLHLKRLIGAESKSPTVTGVYLMTAQSPEKSPLIQNRGFMLKDAVERYLEIGFLFGKYLYLKNGMTIEGNAFGAVRLGQTYTGEEQVTLASGETLSTLRTERVSEVLLEYGIDLRIDYPTNPANDQGVSLIIHQNLRSLTGEVEYESPLFGIGYFWRPSQQKEQP